MSAPSKSVFISYAREDLAAARRIAEALSAYEVEVWFDQAGLDGGDAWDQKIRRQIKECSLFIPIISAQTQARREAYFRLEWKLAEERTHLMAEGTAFLLPIAIDDTKEDSALVPESFRRTQWTRLPRGEPNLPFLNRVRALQDGQPSLTSPSVVPAAPPSTKRRRTWPVALVLVLAIVASIPFRPRKPGTLPTAAPTPSAPAPVSAVADKSIAVLPFTNISDDKGNALFADGLHEDLLTQLALIGDLKVTSRTSVEEYRNTTKNIRRIGAELGAANLLEGSVRRIGDKVRVTAQLIDARSDRHLWAKTYDKNLNDVFAIQTELAIEIARSLQSTLSPGIRSVLARVPTQNMAAYELLLRQQATSREGVELPDINALIDLLNQAVQLDPGLAIAWARLGTMHARQIFDFQDTSPERLARAQAAINRALELAPTAPEVRLELGNFYYYAFRDYAKAEAIYGEILALAPYHVEVLAQMGYVLRREGRFRESNVYLEKVLTIDPRHQRALGNLHWNFMRIRDYPGAMATARRLIALRPLDLPYQIMLQRAAWMAHRTSTDYDAWRALLAPGLETQVRQLAALDFNLALARRDLAAAERLLPAMREKARTSSLEALFWRAKGDTQKARQLAEAALAGAQEILRKRPDDPAERAELSLVLALLGDPEAAWREYRRACELLPDTRDAFTGANVVAYGVRLHALMGERTEALAGMRRPIRAAPLFGHAYAPSTDLAFATLWDDPEFKAIDSDSAYNAMLQ